MRRPIRANPPHLGELRVELHKSSVSLPYFKREGAGGPSVFCVPGLGAPKENFAAALQSPALADCTLVSFDAPGTGLAEFDPDAGLGVSGLADIAHAVADHLLPEPYVLAGSSMGGLINLLQIRRHGLGEFKP